MVACGGGQAFLFLYFCGAAARGEAAAEAREADGPFERGARGEWAAGESGEGAEGGVEAFEHGDAMAREADRRGNGGEFGDGLEVAGVVVVGPAEGAGEFASVADDEVADESGPRGFDDEAKRPWRVTGDGDGADAGEDVGLAVDGEGDEDRRGATEEECGDKAHGVAAADAGAEHEVTVAEAAVPGAGDDGRAGCGGDGCGGPGVVAVAVGEQDGLEGTAEGSDGLEDGRRAIGEPGIDEGEASGWEEGEEDVGAAGAVEPPDAGDDFFGWGGSHRLAVSGGWRWV